MVNDTIKNLRTNRAITLIAITCCISLWSNPTLSPAETTLRASNTTCKAQDLMYQGAVIGHIYYQDTMQGQIIERFIDKLYITPSHRNKGYGTHLMQQFVEQSRQEKITVLRGYSEPKAQSFYQRLNFTLDTATNPMLNTFQKTINPISESVLTS